MVNKTGEALSPRLHVFHSAILTDSNQKVFPKISYLIRLPFLVRLIGFGKRWSLALI